MSRADRIVAIVGGGLIAAIVGIAIVLGSSDDPSAAGVLGDDWVYVQVDVSEAFSRGATEPDDEGLRTFHVRPDDVVAGDPSIVLRGHVNEAANHMRFDLRGQWPNLGEHPRVLSSEGLPISDGERLRDGVFQVSVAGNPESAGVLTFVLTQCVGESHLETVREVCEGR